MTNWELVTKGRRWLREQSQGKGTPSGVSRAAGEEEGDRSKKRRPPAVSLEGDGTQETCSFIELCSAIQH